MWPFYLLLNQGQSLPEKLTLKATVMNSLLVPCENYAHQRHLNIANSNFPATFMLFKTRRILVYESVIAPSRLFFEFSKLLEPSL